jgi:hypothetical protein
MVYLPCELKVLESQRYIRRSKVALPHWLRETIQVTDQGQGPEPDENVMAFPRSRIDPVRNDGQSAIDLVYQAAEVVSNVHDQARRMELHAQTLCKTALEKLRFAERRAESAEKALNISESRIASAEVRLCAAEQRAKKAETMARELDQALSLVEEAIKTRLLGESPSAYASRRGAAA